MHILFISWSIKMCQQRIYNFMTGFWQNRQNWHGDLVSCMTLSVDNNTYCIVSCVCRGDCSLLASVHPRSKSLGWSVCDLALHDETLENCSSGNSLYIISGSINDLTLQIEFCYQIRQIVNDFFISCLNIQWSGANVKNWPITNSLIGFTSAELYSHLLRFIHELLNLLKLMMHVGFSWMTIEMKWKTVQYGQ